MTQTSALPWRLQPNAYGSQFIYANEEVPSGWNDTKFPVLVAGGDNYTTLKPANAALIVRAVNSHEALVKALEPFCDLDGEGTEDYPDDKAVIVSIGRHTNYELKLGDLRHARSALSAASNSQEGEG